MKYYLIYVIALCATSSIAQDNELAPSIIKGNWQFEFLGLDRLAPVGIGDTMLLYKSPKRLKLKKNRPVRFKQDGTVLMPQVPLGACGSVGTLESLWYLKWKEYGTWAIHQQENQTLLQFDDLSLILITQEKKQYTFIVSDIIENTTNRH